MRGRDFIKVIAASAVPWPLPAHAQQPAMPVVGFINSASAKGYAPFFVSLSQRAERSPVDGQNVAIEYKWADGQYDQLPVMAADLVHRRVAVIAATTTPAAIAAKAANRKESAIRTFRLGRASEQYPIATPLVEQYEDNWQFRAEVPPRVE